VNLAGYGIHIDFMGFLSIHDLNLVHDAAIIFPHIHFICLLSLEHARRLSTYEPV